MKRFILGLFTAISLSAQAQTILIKNHPITPVKNTESIHNLSTITNQHFQNRTYCIVQFGKTISLKERQQIELQTGIRFFDYIPRFAFLAAIPDGLDPSTLSAFNIKSIVAYDPAYKVAPNLSSGTLPAWIQKNGSLEIEIEVFADLSASEAETLLAQQNIKLNSWRTNHHAVVTIPETQLSSLSSIPWIKYIQATSAPAVKENWVERNDHRINTIDNAFYTGLHYDGTGVSVAEGDDGAIGFHIDFAGRLTNHSTDTTGVHGDHVAGIIAGGGNFDPITSGNARGADLHAYDNYQNLYNVNTDYNLYGVRITSNSLGQSCNSGYDADAQASDGLILSKPSLMSVHSAGNSGSTTCGGVANGYYTITGGYKSGKNVIAVGNVDYNDVINSSSSKGPSEDGRIKPEVVAVGTNVYSTQPYNNYSYNTGTSMACPAVSGTLASLWQAYRDTHAGADPRSDVMKAILLNTSDDLGTRGPDYTYGFGRVNARRAYDVIANDQFFIDSTETFSTNEHYITVPPGTKQVKVMLYWHEIEGNLASSIALVNNLNLRMKDDNSTIYQPWVLNHSTNPALLAQPAIKGNDSLNNMEQITIDSMAAGDYAILVSGIDVPFGPQTYVITYEFIRDDVSLTFPHGGEALVGGVTERVRWDAYGNNNGAFLLEYSEDGGTSWNTISSSIPATARYYDWTPPTGLYIGNMMMRISQGAFSDITDTFCTIIGVPNNLVVDTACENRFHVSWDSVAGADGYILYTMGTKYMQQLLTTTTNSVYINTGVNLTDTFYYAVAAVNSTTGAIGRRSICYVKYPGEVNCVDDLFNVQTILPFETAYNCAATGPMQIKVKLKNIGLKDVGNFPVSYQVGTNPIVTENCTTLIPIGDSTIFTFTTPASFAILGTYNVKTWTHIWTDTHLSNDTSSASATVILPTTFMTPMSEDFEGPLFPPPGWRIFDQDTNNVKWQKTLCFSGINGGNTHAAYMDFYNYGNLNQIDDLETYQYNSAMQGGMDSLLLDFDISAAYNSLSQDTLSVWISNDCGVSYQPLPYKKWGTSLATVGSKPNIFSPITANQWRHESIDITPYLSQKIFIKFRGVNQRGNNVYIDNVNIYGKNEIPAGVHDINAANIAIYPNPSTNGVFTLDIPATTNSEITYRVLSSSGQVIQQVKAPVQKGKNQVQIDLSKHAKGIYFLEVQDGTQNSKVKLTVL